MALKHQSSKSFNSSDTKEFRPTPDITVTVWSGAVGASKSQKHHLYGPWWRTTSPWFDQMLSDGKKVLDIAHCDLLAFTQLKMIVEAKSNTLPVPPAKKANHSAEGAGVSSLKEYKSNEHGIKALKREKAWETALINIKPILYIGDDAAFFYLYCTTSRFGFFRDAYILTKKLLGTRFTEPLSLLSFYSAIQQLPEDEHVFHTVKIFPEDPFNTELPGDSWIFSEEQSAFDKMKHEAHLSQDDKRDYCYYNPYGSNDAGFLVPLTENSSAKLKELMGEATSKCVTAIEASECIPFGDPRLALIREFKPQFMALLRQPEHRAAVKFAYSFLKMQKARGITVASGPALPQASGAVALSDDKKNTEVKGIAAIESPTAAASPALTEARADSPPEKAKTQTTSLARQQQIQTEEKKIEQARGKIQELIGELLAESEMAKLRNNLPKIYAKWMSTARQDLIRAAGSAPSSTTEIDHLKAKLKSSDSDSNYESCLAEINKIYSAQLTHIAQLEKFTVEWDADMKTLAARLSSHKAHVHVDEKKKLIEPPKHVPLPKKLFYKKATAKLPILLNDPKGAGSPDTKAEKLTQTAVEVVFKGSMTFASPTPISAGTLTAPADLAATPQLPHTTLFAFSNPSQFASIKTDVKSISESHSLGSLVCTLGSFNGRATYQYHVTSHIESALSATAQEFKPSG
ncbi:hypothetical protein BH10PSE19_BH10PSE19_07560 [soil metagenome]